MGRGIGEVDRGSRWGFQDLGGTTDSAPLRQFEYGAGGSFRWFFFLFLRFVSFSHFFFFYNDASFDATAFVSTI